MKNILVPVDFSENSLNALKYAFSIAEKMGSGITIFHTYSTPASDVHIPFTDVNFTKKTVSEDAQFQLEQLQTEYKLAHPGVQSDTVLKNIFMNEI